MKQVSGKYDSQCCLVSCQYTVINCEVVLPFAYANSLDQSPCKIAVKKLPLLWFQQFLPREHPDISTTAFLSCLWGQGQWVKARWAFR